MEDNLADDEIEIELAPLAVQLAYVQQVSNDMKHLFVFFEGQYLIANNASYLCYFILSAPWKHTRSHGSLHRHY